MCTDSNLTTKIFDIDALPNFSMQWGSVHVPLMHRNSANSVSWCKIKSLVVTCATILKR